MKRAYIFDSQTETTTDRQNRPTSTCCLYHVRQTRAKQHPPSPPRKDPLDRAENPQPPGPGSANETNGPHNHTRYTKINRCRYAAYYEKQKKGSTDLPSHSPPYLSSSSRREPGSRRPRRHHQLPSAVVPAVNRVAPERAPGWERRMPSPFLPRDGPYRHKEQKQRTEKKTSLDLHCITTYMLQLSYYHIIS